MWRVGAQQSDGAGAAPATEHEVLVFGFGVRTADLEDGPHSIRGAYRLNNRAAPCDGIAVGHKLPLVELALEHDLDQSSKARPTICGSGSPTSSWSLSS